MRTPTKIIVTTAVAALFAAGGFTVGAIADGTGPGEVRHARSEMHSQMGGDAGMEMMGAHDMATMQAMHEAMDPEAMESMHDQMIELLPPEMRDDANAMHSEMTRGSAMGGSSAERHGAHHPAGS